MRKILLMACLSNLLFSQDFGFSHNSETIKHEEEKEVALFTGPLLAPSAITVPAGHIDIEPYLYLNFDTGVYNNHWEHQSADHLPRSIQFDPLIQIGLTSYMDFDLIPEWIYRKNGSYSASGFADLSVQFGFQLLRQNHYPISLKLAIQETFPTGRYERLDPRTNGVDGFGSGAYTTRVMLASAHNIPLSIAREFRMRFAMSYSIPSKVHVHGINSYGGDSTTNGYVTNAGTFDAVFGMEYSITSQWVLAFDIDSLYQNPTNFSGTTIEPVGKNESTYVLSMAPAVEYNFNKMFGLIGGVWFSVLGYNHTSYINGVIALNVYI